MDSHYRQTDDWHCALCAQEVGPEDRYERCWWCRSVLCMECFADMGNCGHAEVQLINKQSVLWRNTVLEHLTYAMNGMQYPKETPS